MARSFSDIYGEVHAKKFGKPTQPAPVASQNLAQEIGRVAANADAQPPAPPATPVQAADDGSDDREVTCPACGHTFVPDYQSDSSTSETGEDDPDNGNGDDLDTPAWDKTASPGLSWRTRKATAGERRSLKRD